MSETLNTNDNPDYFKLASVGKCRGTFYDPQVSMSGGTIYIM